MMAACQVTAVIGPVLLYQVTLADGRLAIWRRHQGQLLRATHMTDVQAEPDNDFDFDAIQAQNLIQLAIVQ